MEEWPQVVLKGVGASCNITFVNTTQSPLVFCIKSILMPIICGGGRGDENGANDNDHP